MRIVKISTNSRVKIHFHQLFMTTQSENLAGRIPPGPIRVQRVDKSTYVEHNPEEVARMVKAMIVEGVGPRSGRIDILRVIVSDEEAVKRLSDIPFDRPPEQSPGSITSMASREVYREVLGESGHWCWDFKRNRNAFSAA